MQFNPSYLFLKTGQSFPGLSPAYQKGDFFGEVVFNTGMTGYVETLTDPSYNGQILAFTYPLIGNYGVPKSSTWESKKIHVAGVILSEACLRYSHQTGLQSLLEWFKEERVPVIADIDTRALTKVIRESGVMLGAITSGTKKITKFVDPNTRNLVAEVSILKPKIYGHGKKRIIAVDCGMKENIMRCLQKYPWTIVRVPYDYDYSTEKFDGVFLSNGPGDPAKNTKTIEVLKKVLKLKKPVFGICLGSQIMALSAGAKTYKLRYGHRGQNQPCQEKQTEKCVITSQNHGYAVDEKTLPPGWLVNFKNLNDNSVEGVAHTSLPFFSVQFHPEANPGPTDTEYLFEKFYSLV